MEVEETEAERSWGSLNDIERTNQAEPDWTKLNGIERSRTKLNNAEFD